MVIEISTISLTLLLANALLLAIATVCMIRFRREARTQREFWQSPTGAALAGEQPADAADRAAVGDRRRYAQSIMRLEQQMLELRKDFHRTSAAASPDPVPKQTAAPLPLENAARMAKHGASVDELTARCGLSLGEARLLQKLHSNSHTHH
ncbi:MAG: DUF2802 domain-containing protein [Pseudomonadota bacterium]